MEYERLFGIIEALPSDNEPNKELNLFLPGAELRSSFVLVVGGSSIYYPLSSIFIPNSSTHPIRLK